MATDKKKCKGCGSNIKPECRGCPWNVSEVNQTHVVRVGKESHEKAVSSFSYRKNQHIRYSLLTYRDEMYQEGSE